MLILATGIGGVIAMFITCYFIKYVWNAIVHYGEERELEKAERELEKQKQSTRSSEQ
jgi:hypothetical protein